MSIDNKNILEILQSGTYSSVLAVFIDEAYVGNPLEDREDDHVFQIHRIKNSKLKKYAYKTNYDFEPGDFAVVEVSYCLKIVQIVEVAPDESLLDFDLNKPYKWIVQKVDSEEYFEQRAKEEEFRKRLLQAKKRKAVREFKQEIIADISDNKLLLEINPDIKELINHGAASKKETDEPITME